MNSLMNFLLRIIIIIFFFFFFFWPESYEKQRGDQKETIKGKKAPETRQYEDKTGAVGKNDAESDEGVSQKGTVSGGISCNILIDVVNTK